VFLARVSALEVTYSPIGLRPPWRTELRSAEPLLSSEHGAEGSVWGQEGGEHWDLRVGSGT
jgi:hypothetical protein